jgi:hypothetical protein
VNVTQPVFVDDQRIKAQRLYRAMRADEGADAEEINVAKVCRLEKDERLNVSAVILAHVALALAPGRQWRLKQHHQR